MQSTLLTEIDIRHYFHQALTSALDNQRLTLSTESTLYLRELLAGYLRTEHLHESHAGSRGMTPLALRYEEALSARTRVERLALLRRLGDVALFIAGMFARSLERALVDVDYYISMGGNAYASLSVTLPAGRGAAGPGPVYAELAEKFQPCTDILSEVAEATGLVKDDNLLRLYEIWQKTGSPHALHKLRQAGIEPVQTGSCRH